MCVCVCVCVCLCVCVCVCVLLNNRRNQAVASSNESDAVIGAEIGDSRTWLVLRKWRLKFAF